MRRPCALATAALVVLAVVGCGTSGVDKRALEQSVVDAGRRSAQEGLATAIPALERIDAELGIEYSAPGRRTAKLHSPACQDAPMGAASPTGERTIYECFVETGEVGSPQSKWWVDDVGIYWIDGQCWRGAIIGTEIEGKYIPLAQPEIDEAGNQLRGCIGQRQDEPSSIPAVIPGPSGSPSVKPRRLEISEGSHPLVVSHVRWRAWGGESAGGWGILEVVNCRPACASGRYESRGPVRVQLGDVDRECGRVLYRSIKIAAAVLDHKLVRLTCSGVAENLEH